MVRTGPLSPLSGAYPKETDNCGQSGDEIKMHLNMAVGSDVATDWN